MGCYLNNESEIFFFFHSVISMQSVFLSVKNAILKYGLVHKQR